ncbi:uncharacterized protein OCT59_013542 [Rhizophagus irregularis]|uniref:Uncharacterized protein n=1 Tax=Rhizophagus irregularis (strain DAOM 181602 / DAOM 197198 / MUCL 43194) TaxID=747089 RepID=A0A2H5TSW2_RHIID|nr:hypothetical protein GLOIN_2v1494649 [Rhizophagus irregularis DAOM 181602=DAOM 197198]POG82891.1 hypothetical protein GLOIN_2v1494649 [Rhizophagus irregularis DAOM 181602=DAOM 197198]UZO21141.1 hypothetical protein OCT59_013542 [Rhizophagus irregularis]GBC45651.1 hypothetical protein GLOIN_2v1494649 [Rhizophagus irregularis DAOM 181602=DAOM 197198]|eukprot:XP_025189757.1 hypothetical protein GLOIN_2v1494649 [Rhizophagus irregularis DAOM 181602=DAOM 197198]
MNAETKKLIQILLIGTCIIKIVSLVLASVVYSRNEEGNNENYNIIWAVIVGLLVVFEITSYIIENRALLTLILTKLILSLCEVVLLVFSYGIECQPKSLCQVNDIFKGFITSCDLLSLIYIIYLHRKLSVLARRRALEANLLDVLGENEYPKNPVPPAVDEVEIEEVMS